MADNILQKGLKAGKEFLFGKDPSTQQLPTMRPEQQQLQNQLIEKILPMLQGQLTQGFNFAPIAKKARTQFQTQTVPSIAERFTSMGQGAQSSGAFRNALGQAGSNLEESLAALESQFGLQQQGQQQNLLSNLLGYGLKSPFENIYQQGTTGFGPQAFEAFLKLLPFIL